MIIINVIEEPIKKNHISYYTRRNIFDHNIIELYEVFDVYYMHPDSDNSAHINRIEDHKIISYKISDKKASPLLLMEYAQNNIKIMINDLL